jgi:lipoate---protein ligase
VTQVALPMHWLHNSVPRGRIRDGIRLPAMERTVELGGASEHARSLAGVDLVAAAPPVLRVEEAREVVVVLSRSRDPAREVDLERCRADAVPVLVRPSGGGAVVLAPGVLAASLLAGSTAGGLFPDPYFRRFSTALARALADCGVAGVVQRGVSDLCLGERKIAGSSLRLWRGRALYQVSLLVRPDLDLLPRYLREPGRAPAYRRGRPHLEFVTSLREAGFSASLADVAAAVRAHLAAELR